MLHVCWGSGDLEPHEDAPGPGCPVPPTLSAGATSCATVSHLECAEIAPRDGKHRATLIYLHPFGAGAAQYSDQAEKYALNGIRIVLPDAPRIPISCHSGRPAQSWYDYLVDHGGRSEDEICIETLASTRAQIHEVINREAALFGSSGITRIIIGGCGQGCGAALDAALQLQRSVAAFVGVAGHALSVTPVEGPHRNLRLHFFVGQDDDLVPWPGSVRSWAWPAVERLRESGHAVSVHGPFPGVGHHVPVHTEVGWLRAVCEALPALPRAGAASMVPTSKAGPRGAPGAKRSALKRPAPPSEPPPALVARLRGPISAPRGPYGGGEADDVEVLDDDGGAEHAFEASWQTDEVEVLSDDDAAPHDSSGGAGEAELLSSGEEDLEN